MIIQPEHIAPFIVRLMLGLIFLFQGYDKVFKIGTSQVVDTIAPAYRKLRLPHGLVVITAWFTSWAELAGGVLLIIGLFKYCTLYILGLDLLLVSLGMALLNPVWNMQHVFYRFVMLVFLLVYPADLDTITLDAVFR